MTGKRFLVLMLAFFSTVAYGQTVKVKKEKSTVKGEPMEGVAVVLDGTSTEVNAALVRFLKTVGKVKQGDVITVSEPNVNGISFAQPIYGVTNGDGTSATAWVGYNPSGIEKDEEDKLKKELESLMKDFGVKFYRDKIQVQIDESMRAVQTVERQQQRLLNENKSLNTKLENNKKSKIQLEKSLENNKVEYETLLKQIEQNKKAQDSVAVAAQQIKKVVDVQKEKQSKVN